MTFRVLLDIQVRPGQEDAFERTWREVAEGIAAHPANRGQSLLRGEDAYYVITDWTDESAFRQFELSPAHVDNRARLAPYRTGGSMATMPTAHERVRVILWYRVPKEEVQPLSKTYQQISEQLVGTPGMLGNELLHSQVNETTMAVTSYWESAQHLQDWVHSSSHRHTSPLRPYLDTAREQPYETFTVVSAF
ncbi:antibiotic biosynthesis monooxygenase family protein [Nonomuraea sp. NPDC050394]|uniref:antibiotic biosynthesis monooxygenase family protein n=1 Tax=Nonomuraea sp. NPDC050394 TaxID=3364363 RepID=UPI00378CBB79